jgi:hypothetical protein
MARATGGAVYAGGAMVTWPESKKKRERTAFSVTIAGRQDKTTGTSRDRCMVAGL